MAACIALIHIPLCCMQVCTDTHPGTEKIWGDVPGVLHSVTEVVRGAKPAFGTSNMEVACHLHCRGLVKGVASTLSDGQLLWDKLLNPRQCTIAFHDTAAGDWRCLDVGQRAVADAQALFLNQAYCFYFETFSEISCIPVHAKPAILIHHSNQLHHNNKA